MPTQVHQAMVTLGELHPALSSYVQVSQYGRHVVGVRIHTPALLKRC